MAHDENGPAALVLRACMWLDPATGDHGDEYGRAQRARVAAALYALLDGPPPPPSSETLSGFREKSSLATNETWHVYREGVERDMRARARADAEVDCEEAIDMATLIAENRVLRERVSELAVAEATIARLTRAGMVAERDVAFYRTHADALAGVVDRAHARGVLPVEDLRVLGFYESQRRS